MCHWTNRRQKSQAQNRLEKEIDARRFSEHSEYTGFESTSITSSRGQWPQVGLDLLTRLIESSPLLVVLK